MIDRAHFLLRFFLVSFLVTPVSSRAFAETQTFKDPTIKGVRLDWCKHWSRDCGRPAADLFCRERGFERASQFSIDKDIGKRGIETVVFGDGRVCKAPTCSGFQSIACERTQPAERQRSAEPSLPGSSDAKFPLSRKALEESTPKAPEIRQAVPGKVLTPAEKNKPITVPRVKVGSILPGGASLFHCARGDCEFALSHDLEIKPSAANRTAHFRWNVSKVPGANGVLWQIATQPFASFGGGSKTDLSPPDLVASGEMSKQIGSFFPDFGEIASKVAAAPGSFYVRILPLAGPGTAKIVGQPSNVIRVYYAAAPPAQVPVKIYAPETRRDPGPIYTLVRVEYTPYNTIHKWPPGCKEIPRDEGRSGLEAVGYAFEKTFEFASESFDWLKSRVVDAASFVTGGVVPRDVFEAALTAALVSAGIPPDIPNFNEILSAGADQLAGEIAKQVVTQLPAGEVAGKLGEVATDLTKDQIQKMIVEQGADAVRARLEEELERQTKDALRKAAAAAEAEMLRKAKDTYCRGKSTPPTYRVVIRNTGGRSYRSVRISISDSERIFQAASGTLNLAKNQTATVILMPEPEIRNVHKSQLAAHDESRNQSHWFQKFYAETKTRVVVRGTGDTVCEKRMAPPFDWQCHDAGRSLLSPGAAVLLSAPHAWP